LHNSVLEILVGVERLAELPPPGRHVEELNVLPAGADHGEAKLLAYEGSVRLPVGAPVPGHLHPSRVPALDPCSTQPLPAKFWMLTSKK
jgi:hypothetical protein